MTEAPIESAARTEAAALIRDYYAAFNRGDTDTMLKYVTEDVIHDINQGERRQGKDKFREFNAHMTKCYKEELKDIVVMISKDATHASAEFVVHGIYKTTDEGLPPANGQKYVLPAGTFFTIRDGKIARVTTYYNLEDWKTQVLG